DAWQQRLDKGTEDGLRRLEARQVRDEVGMRRLGVADEARTCARQDRLFCRYARVGRVCGWWWGINRGFDFVVRVYECYVAAYVRVNHVSEPLASPLLLPHYLLLLFPITIYVHSLLLLLPTRRHSPPNPHLRLLTQQPPHHIPRL